MIKTLLDHTFYIDKINDVVIVDLGANDGRFYAECLDHFGTTSIKSYIGVEPNKILYDDLKIKYNDTNLIWVNKAVYKNSDQDIVFTEVDNHEAGNILGHENQYFKWGLENPNNYLVKTITIEDLIKNYNLDQIDYLKIDIEGAEYDLIDSLNNDICNKITQISVEFHDFIDPELKNKSKQYVDKLKNLGYRLHSAKKWSGRYGTDYMDTLFIRK